MSYTQQFYLQSDEATVRDESYDGELLQQFCGQRDTQEWFESFGVVLRPEPCSVRISFSSLQLSKMFAALSQEVANFMDAFRTIAEDAYNIQENAPGYTADRIALESYVALSLAHNRFLDVQDECPFFNSLNSEDPLALLLRYHNVIGGFISRMKGTDMLILSIGY